MNTKQVKHYEILSELFASDLFSKAVVEKYFNAILKLDYTLAEDLWEFMLIHYDAELKNSAVVALYIDCAFSVFYKASETKTIKTILDRPVIANALFKFSPTAADGALFALPVNLLVSNKVEVVDTIFKLVSKNEAMKPSFGKYMVAFLDRFFIEMMKKSAQRRVELNRKQFNLLMTTVQKVHGDERAMLIQRVKEVG